MIKAWHGTSRAESEAIIHARVVGKIGHDDGAGTRVTTRTSVY